MCVQPNSQHEKKTTPPIYPFIHLEIYFVDLEIYFVDLEIYLSI